MSKTYTCWSSWARNGMRQRLLAGEDEGDDEQSADDNDGEDDEEEGVAVAGGDNGAAAVSTSVVVGGGEGRIDGRCRSSASQTTKPTSSLQHDMPAWRTEERNESK